MENMNLALQLLTESNFNQSIIESFKNNILLKTNAINPCSVVEEELSEQDNKAIAQLQQKGFQVYHIIVVNKMIGNTTDINSEFKINTFQNVVTETNYLYVPRIIQHENDTTQAILRVDDHREDIFLEEFIDFIISRVQNGIHYSYSVKGVNNSFPTCRDISISNYNGSIILDR
jgi:hypothetical protein